MKNIPYLMVFAAICAAIFAGTTPAAHAAASGCYADPVTVTDWTATITAPVNVRNQACIEGSVNLFSLQTGTEVHVIAQTNGWYRVEYNNKRVWVGSDFVNVTVKRFGGMIFPTYSLYMSKYAVDMGNAPSSSTSTVPNYMPSPFTPTTPAAPSTPTTPSTPSTQTYYDPALLGHVSGYILLQVQSHGEAWYVDPQTAKRYYMANGTVAYQMMRSFGLGMTEANYAKIAAGNTTMKKQLSGRIILRVQAHGEAYYIHPGDLKVYYLQNGDEAYRVMRLYSLGITNTDLEKLPAAEIQVK